MSNDGCMRVLSFLKVVFCGTVSCAVLLAEPIKEREWTSTAGTKLVASALEIEGGEVVLQRSSGKVIRVAVSQLVDADRAILEKHFSMEEPSGEAGKRAEVTGLPHPQGQAIGPIDAGGGKYFLYLPENLVQGRLAPLLFFTGSGGGNASHVKRCQEGAEVNGWIVAASVESRNGKDGRAFVKAAMAHIQATLPVDPERLYFTGNSGGGVVAVNNCANFKGAGAMPFIAHGLAASMPSKKGHYYFVNGATDYNRYGSASMRKSYKDHAFHRFHAGAHSYGPNSIAQDGMAWLNGRYLAEKASDRAFAEERDDYEKAMLRWAGELQKSAPHRALLQLDFLVKEYEISGANATKAQEMVSELFSDPNNVRYVEALFAIDEFSQKRFSDLGGSSRHKHTSKEIQKGAAKLETEYQGVPEVPEILKNLQKQTI